MGEPAYSKAGTNRASKSCLRCDQRKSRRAPCFWLAAATPQAREKIAVEAISRRCDAELSHFGFSGQATVTEIKYISIM
jgi:hypothetical protein